jgi:hypothetical protein
MARPPFEVADVLRSYGEAYRQSRGESIPESHLRVVHDIKACRTAELGGHVDTCTNCGAQEISYNSCRNRHCPKCQSAAKARWLSARQAELLPVGYFHVVFTLPEQIAKMGLQNKRLIYDLLFKATAETLRKVAADPRYLGAEIGFLAVLHTWGQTLSFHPHLHCVIPGGGFAPKRQRWIACRKEFFLPVRVLGRHFCRIFLELLLKAYRQGALQFYGELAELQDSRRYAAWIRQARRHKWIVYAKKPFGGPQQVLDYLGRYTHRVAISNHRITNIADGQVTFSWRDYRTKKLRLMTLDASEFIRRFLQHVLPNGYVRIRHFGFLANRNRSGNIEKARQLLAKSEGQSPSTTKETPLQPQLSRPCPHCGRGFLVNLIPSTNEPQGCDSS